MRWLAALGVILLAFGVFVFLEARGSTSANAGAEVQRAPEKRAPAATTAPEAPSSAIAPRTPEAQRPTMAAVVENIRTKASAKATGTAPSLEGAAAPAEGSSGSGDERAPDADDYLPYPDGSEPSSMRVKLRGAARRMNNGNYKGAFEAADSQIQMWPDLWEAYTTAVPSLCAMGDTDKAASYLARVTDEPSRKQIIEGCAGFGVTLP